jgi:hypothetical protein
VRDEDRVKWRPNDGEGEQEKRREREQRQEEERKKRREREREEARQRERERAEKEKEQNKEPEKEEGQEREKEIESPKKDTEDTQKKDTREKEEGKKAERNVYRVIGEEEIRVQKRPRKKSSGGGLAVSGGYGSQIYVIGVALVLVIGLGALGATYVFHRAPTQTTARDDDEHPLVVEGEHVEEEPEMAPE